MKRAIIIGVIIVIGIVLLQTKSSETLGIVNPIVSIDGKMVEMKFTDDNTGECLIIHSDQKDYYGWGGAVTNFTVENTCGTAENVNIVSSMPDGITFSYLHVKTGEKVTIFPATSFTHSTTTGKTDTIPAKTTIRTEWQLLSNDVIPDRSQFTISKKAVAEVEIHKSDAVLIAAGQTKVFKMSRRFHKIAQGEEFFIEAFGSNGGYGHLDPNDWTATVPLDVGGDNANVTGTGDGTGWSGNWAQGSSGADSGMDYDNTRARPDGSDFHLESTAGDHSITRSLTTSVDTGIVQFYLQTDSTGSITFRLQIGSGGSDRCGIRMGSSDIEITDGLSQNPVTFVSSYAADTWFLIHLKFDSTAGTCSAREDSVSTFSSNVTMSNSGNIDEFEFAHSFIHAYAGFGDAIAQGSDVVVAVDETSIIIID